MTFIVEDGSGVFGANSYASVEDVEAYLGDRCRLTSSNWSGTSLAARQSHIIAATDYVEQRFQSRFKGSPQFPKIIQARASLTIPSLPLDTETVTIGSQVYTFNTVLGGSGSVLIGANPIDSLNNLVAALLDTEVGGGTRYGAGTPKNAEVTAFAAAGRRIVVWALVTGETGDFISVSTTVTGASWNFPTLNGGAAAGEGQPLSFPRVNMFLNNGTRVVGIPTKLKCAIAEYAIRAAAASLLPDPTFDESGKSIRSKSRKVGPIETSIEYEPGNSTPTAMRAYPAADKMLDQYLYPPGRVYRG